ncbi:MAG: lipopolysaccharide kinase InaA family protein [Methylotenera sp.]
MSKNTQPSMLTKQVIYDGLSYILQGGLRIKNGHLPPSGHTIPNDFFGLCVASAADPAMDAYVIAQLSELGCKQVHLDFTYGDLTSFNTRFLRALIAENFAVTLHIIQPFAAAKNMQNPTEQVIWREFLRDVLNTFGSQIRQIEIGTTINRKRWAGYTFDGFLAAWNIAHTLIKDEINTRGITLLGPNVQDFEPFYNISLLKTLRTNNQLPDIHSNNLFVERVSEPERFDHRIFKYRWATIFKYNLIKKARILNKIAQDFGVPRTISSAAFWAIYRIERLLENGAQKQADYLTRYFTLLAASGALQQANWGAFICHREGLIDDGLNDAEYPALERITYYKSVDGNLADFKQRPSFSAMQTVIKWLSGAQYLGAISTSNGLEIHQFSNHEKRIDIAWTINGKTAFLADTYAGATLQATQMLHREGGALNNSLELITETPIYLIWNHDFNVVTKANPALAKDLAIHAHIEDLQYFRLNEDDWQGLVLARDADEARLLMQVLHPSTLQSPNKDTALRHARNAIWMMENPIDAKRQITVKQPVKMYPHKAFLDQFKPSKAKRSWNGAVELLRRGVATAPPVAYFEKINDSTLKQNFYICDFVKADCNIGQMFIAFAQGEGTFLGVSQEETYAQLAQFIAKMHARGTFFRDLSGGNVLVNIGENNQLTFSLIDTARARFYNHATPMNERIADLTRVCNKLHWAGRERLMGHYLGLLGRKLTFRLKLPFYLYDAKVWLKRRVGRKGIKKLMKKFKSARD